MRCGPAILCASILLTIAAGVPGQTPQPRLTFDVAAIHPAEPGSDHGFIKPSPG